MRPNALHEKTLPPALCAARPGGDAAARATRARVDSQGRYGGRSAAAERFLRRLLLFLRRAVKAAESAEAGAIVFEMNTYGGRLDTAAEITGVLNHATIPTYTFINSNAGSAGSLIALATRHIYMSPVSAIGAAAPVLSTGEDLPAPERKRQFPIGRRSFAAPPRATAIIPTSAKPSWTKEKEVKIGDRVVHPKGSLLTLTAQEATEKYQRQTVAGRGHRRFGRRSGAESRTQRATRSRFDPSGFERLAFWITALAPLASPPRNHLRLSRVQNSGRRVCPGSLRLFVSRFFSSAIIWRAWPAGKSSRFSSSASSSFWSRSCFSRTRPSSSAWSASSSCSARCSGQ